jgi:NAD/NADP transhydrogenase alpha subunit
MTVIVQDTNAPTQSITVEQVIEKVVEVGSAVIDRIVGGASKVVEYSEPTYHTAMSTSSIWIGIGLFLLAAYVVTNTFNFKSFFGFIFGGSALATIWIGFIGFCFVAVAPK